ncbi:helix-turn-helix domain-containing protein [uncultured Alteromonas sp.]|uniref:AraC family transcriptional regulator n=1 Tax=uncultured Alteromonas sp. TaxID=179113 RepID=UPI0025EE72FF|nr:helix-turn-helix domain-containing protein [uncultured Alteromonas sp.]
MQVTITAASGIVKTRHPSFGKSLDLQYSHHRVSGVMHHSDSQKHYRLRRYVPDAPLANLVEQYWLVNWQLKNGQEHVQRNLPDPNFHLTFDNQGVKLIGPVSKVYHYPMAASGFVIGVKFNPGSLNALLDSPLSDYVDKELSASKYFGSGVTDIFETGAEALTDEKVVSALNKFLVRFVEPVTAQQTQVARLLEYIKNSGEIYTVAQLAQRADLSVRTLQRLFNQYIGLSPKWLLRKYRLHDALEELETNTLTMIELATQLEYTDQSHLIRDFKDMLGMSPAQYLSDRYAPEDSPS